MKKGLVDTNIHEVVVMVMRWRGISQHRLAKKMGMQRSTLTYRFRSYDPRPWTAAELGKLSVVLRVPIGMFFMDPSAISGRLP